MRDRPSARLLRAFPLTLAVAFLVGCAGGASVTVNTSIPRPLVDSMPVEVGVYYDETLAGYVHEEDLEYLGEYSIDLGTSQIPVFERVFDAMFDRVVPVAERVRAQLTTTALPSAGAAEEAEEADEATATVPVGPDPQLILAELKRQNIELDALLIPKIQQLQFAIPEQTRTDFYEVWIRYEMQLFAMDGSQIAQWDVHGYGKSNRRNFGMMESQKEPALNEAAVWALRDAAAFLSFYFTTVSGVKEWLESTEQETQS